MALKEFNMQVVHRVPDHLCPGIIYVCFDCNLVAHLCACGCGEKVILPIDPDCWSVKYDGETVSLAPSIGNFQFPCMSHYWIKENRVIWADVYASTRQNRKKRKRKKKSWRDRLRMFR